MDDYIRREDYCEENCGKENREGYKTCKNCGMLNVPSADVQSVDRWISVKDSVPEAGVDVLVTDGIHMMVTWCEYIDNQCLWVDNYYTYVNVRFKEVTHWMPLPEPPKDGDT